LFESDGRTPANFGKPTICADCSREVKRPSVLGSNEFLNSSKRKCFYCEQRYVADNEFRRSSDHIIPKSKGGKSYKHNTVYAHQKCNKYKASLTLEEFKVVIKGKGLPFERIMIRNVDRLIEAILKVGEVSSNVL